MYRDDQHISISSKCPREPILLLDWNISNTIFGDKRTEYGNDHPLRRKEEVEGGKGLRKVPESIKNLARVEPESWRRITRKRMRITFFDNRMNYTWGHEFKSEDADGCGSSCFWLSRRFDIEGSLSEEEPLPNAADDFEEAREVQPGDSWDFALNSSTKKRRLAFSWRLMKLSLCASARVARIWSIARLNSFCRRENLNKRGIRMDEEKKKIRIFLFRTQEDKSMTKSK